MKKILLIILSFILYVGSVNAAVNCPEIYTHYDEKDVLCMEGDNCGFDLKVATDIHEKINADFGTDAEKHPSNTYYKITSDNEILYCSNVLLTTQHLKTEGIEQIDKCCRKKTNSRNSLIYIYEYGYGENKKNENYAFNTKYLTGTYTKDYYITQTAIWYFLPPGQSWLQSDWNNNWFKLGYDFTAGTYYGKTYDAVTKATNLIKDANAAKNATPSLELSASNTSMNITSDGKYYISDKINITGKYLTEAISVSATGINGAFIVQDKNATSGISSISDGTNSSVSETIYVKVPIEKITNTKASIKLNISSKSTFNDKSEIIECDPNVNNYLDEGGITDQSMIKYNPSYTTLSKEITLTANKYQVKISKTDSNGKSLSGAALVVKQGDKIVETWITTNEIKTILLAPGTYTLSETKAPNGYILNNKDITFTVTNDNSEVMNVINEPIIINISKRRIKEEKELAGATLRITDEKGNVAKDVNGKELEWITSDKPQSFHIAPGTYFLEEIKAPEGYELSDKKIEFKVYEDGTVTIKEGLIVKKDVKVENNLISFENSPKPEQVPTGNIASTIAVILCTISLGISIYIIIKRKEI